MITRKNYVIEQTASHHDYFAQFVTGGILALIQTKFRTQVLAEAYKADKHMNAIPLSQWDDLEPYIKQLANKKLLNETGEGWSMCTNVCIAKAAARILIGVAE